MSGPREEDEALWMCGPSLSYGVCIESGDRSVRSRKTKAGEREEGCVVVVVVLRTLLLGGVSKEAGVLIPSSLTIIHDLSSFRIQKMDIF